MQAPVIPLSNQAENHWLQASGSVYLDPFGLVYPPVYHMHRNSQADDYYI